MKVTEKAWLEYIARLRRVNDTAASKMLEYLTTHEYMSAVGRKAALDYAYAISTQYGEAATALACEMYDAMAVASGVVLPPAVPAETATYGDVAKAVNGSLKQTGSPEVASNAVGRLVKRSGVDTTMQNAIRDGAEWAWIPHGDTCAFCITLASNGWQKASRKALKNGHAEHIHANCDCTYAVRFDGRTEYAGYDPDEYLEQYRSAKGNSWREKLSSIRKAQYAAEAEKIKAQKRAAYARKKEQEARNFRELVRLHTKYGSPEGLLTTGSGEEIERYSALMKELGLTQKQIRAKMFENPEYWESILSSQSKNQADQLTEQLLRTATDDELHALHMWTGSTFGNINRAMRYGVEVDPISANAAREIENVLDRVTTTEDMVVKRGTGTKTIFEQLGVSWGDDPTSFVGKSWTDNGFVATSPFKYGGFGGAGKNQAELFIFVPEGTHAAYIEQESGLVLERELLIQRGYSYRIVRAEYRENPLPVYRDEGATELKLWVELVTS